MDIVIFIFATIIVKMHLILSFLYFKVMSEKIVAHIFPAICYPS